MADAQLLAYVKTQLEGGAKAEDVKKALLASGWGASDVEESLKAALPQPAPAQPAPAPAAAPVSTSPIVQAQSREKPKDPATKESAKAPTAPTGGAGVVDSVVAHEITFPKEMAEAAKKSGVVPGLSGRGFSRNMIIASALLGLSVIGNGYLIYKNSNAESELNKEIADLTRIKNDETAQVNTLNMQVADLTKKNTALAADNESMKGAAAIGELFALHVSATTLGSSTIVHFDSPTSTVQIKGSLGQMFFGKTLRYVIYNASSGLLVTLMHASSTKADDTLRQFVGTDITIGGTHVAGSRDVTITTLNGDPL